MHSENSDVNEKDNFSNEADSGHNILLHSRFYIFDLNLKIMSN